ncbi:hypothetical protein [Streptomyces sp. B1I3]|uniref:hypothetical protein n=1 Tax=Streptomyces sp. B1I3 TaxID=3042264 RepID=UPI00278B845F|nr:hypothetical protein [Streptomyces sp. B1I3]MDQ0798303.1 tetratricopeptide (TPR) repeat protein [Streptomyces sp. B1I3]
MVKPANDFAYHYPRIQRFPLTYWSEGLIDFLQRRTTSDFDEQAKTLSSLSNAALVFAYLGQLDKAKEICEAQLYWLANNASGSGESSLLNRLALDPWVNMGRLLGYQGETKKALTHFANVHSLASRGEVSFGPCQITSQAWKEIVDRHPHMKGVPQAVYVIDSLKALLQAGDHQGALNFIDSLSCIEHAGIRSLVNERRLIRTPRQGLHYLVNEGMLIAKSRLGRHEEVIANTDDRLSGADIYYEAVLMLYNIESRHVAGVPSAAGRIQKLSILLACGAFDSVPPTTLLRFVEKLGDLLERTEKGRLALGVYTKGLALARQLNDQLAEWTFLKSLMRLDVSSEGQRREWKSAHRQLSAVCEYSAVRRVEETANLSSMPGNVHEKLLGVVRHVTGTNY